MHAHERDELEIARLRLRYAAVRATTERLAAPLSHEDACAQSMPDASPAKWHLAHTTWFFECFVLAPHHRAHVVEPDASRLFNSYYEAVGAPFSRAKRGLLTRPSLDEVRAWRRRVDASMATLFDELMDMPDDVRGRVLALVDLGTHHEEQHQELLLTDVRHLFSESPLEPAYALIDDRAASTMPPTLEKVAFEGGLVEIGHEGAGFAFDNEGPRHVVHLAPFLLASRAVTNGEFLAFVEQDGYARPDLWLSDGFAWATREGIRAPLSWRRDDDGTWTSFTLRGRAPLDLAAPVCHVSHYEADAYARFVGARLPTEHEWEHAARAVGGPSSSMGTLLDDARFVPAPAKDDGTPLAQLFGDVWEWTQSAYLPYPRFRPAAGAVGEYNGKFMSGQMVLRGASALTPRAHVRLTYRNFFQPEKRWQLSGMRLAYDDDR